MSSNRPLRIEIMGQTFDVVWDDTSIIKAGDDVAQFEAWTQRITVKSNNQGPHQQRSAVLHEILHGVVALTNQNDRFVEKGEEEAVGAMAVTLLQVLRTNPHFVAWLVEEIV